MASPYQILYPKNARQGFDGGKNSKFSKQLIADNESPDCLNVIFTNGAPETRLGVGKFNTTSVGTFAGDGLYTRHDRAGSQTMCAFFGGRLYINTGTTFVSVPSATSVFTAGQRVAAAEYENYIFFGNGGGPPYKYNGDFTRQGIPAPTQTSTVASFATGSLSGLYLYKVTNVNSNLVESDLGPPSSGVTVASATIQITDIPTAPASHGVIARRLYRKAISGTTYFRVTTLNDNTTSSITDNLAESLLGAEAPSDQGVPPNYSTIITLQNRLFCNDPANPQFVWYSELDNPYVFKSTNFIRVGDDSGDLVRAFAIHDNGLVVFLDRSVYMIYMPSQNPTEWVSVKLRSSYGSKAPFGNFSYNNKVMFPAMQGDRLVGFAAISGNSVEPEATLLTVSAAGSELKSERIEPDVFLIQETYIPRISAMVFQNKAYLTVTYGDSQITNNRLFIYDFSIGNLSKKQEASWVPWTGLAAEQFTIFGGKLYFITSLMTGFVYEMNKTGQYNDDGTAINSYFQTKEFPGNPGDEQYHKDFRYVNMLYEKAGDFPMGFTYRVDSDVGEGTTIQLDLNPGGSLWGTAVFGVSLWGGGQSDGENRIYLDQTRGKRVQFKFSNLNTVNQKFKIQGLQFSYNKKGRR